LHSSCGEISKVEALKGYGCPSDNTDSRN
jgi:hypothetical protein